MDVHLIRNQGVAGSRPVSGSMRDRLRRLKMRADRIRAVVAQVAARSLGKGEVAVSITADGSNRLASNARWDYIQD